jgi:Domain of unknown function (DUF4337)
MNNTSNLDKEIAELKEFIADLKQDRAAQKDKEQREAWTKYTAVSLVFIAVLAAVATQWSGKYSGTVLVKLNESTFMQAQASDQWSYYQAKSIKQNLYEAMREVAAKSPGTNGEHEKQALESFNAKVAKYEAEKAEIKQKAEQLEQERDAARVAATSASQHGNGMGLSIAIFQISIALASICMVTKKRPLWYVALVLAALATAKMIFVWCN